MRMPTKDHGVSNEPMSSKQKRIEFEILHLPAPVLQGLRDAGFSRMTPIQRTSLPNLLAGHDLCGQAQTGTGKTATFLITIFSKLLREVNPQRRYPLALIIAPTRELALQIYREGMTLGSHTGLRLAAIYGGEGFSRQEKMLRSGVDIVVGTPGRLLDFTRRRVTDLSKIRFLVIDEADRLLDMGFWDELRDILRHLPPPGNRQSMLFSATLDHRSKRIASSYMNHPKDVAVRPEQVTADGIDQRVYHVDRAMKSRLLLGILAREAVPKGLIFANQKITVVWLAKKLSQHGYDVEALTGDMPQNVRNRVLERFKRGTRALLVASDVASRGLHIENVTHIINYDVPQDPEDYVHRIGRTARVGKKGKAYTLACDEYCWSLPEIEKLLGEPLSYEVPYDADYGEDKTPEFTIQQMLRQERGQRRQRDRPMPRKAGSRRPSGHPVPTRDRGPRTAVARGSASNRPRPRGDRGKSPRGGSSA